MVSMNKSGYNGNVENRNIAGNYYPKYSTKKLIEGNLVGKFLNTVDYLVNQLNPADIFEVGCGEGYLISRYGKYGRKLTACDISEQIIARARILAQEKEIDINFLVKNIYELTTKQDKANLVICSEVLEHLMSPEMALNVLAQIANPYLIISVPREPIWRILNMARGKYLKEFGNTPGHLQHWTSNSFTKLIAKNFDILSIYRPFPWTVILARTKYQSNG